MSRPAALLLLSVTAILAACTAVPSSGNAHGSSGQSDTKDTSSSGPGAGPGAGGATGEDTTADPGGPACGEVSTTPVDASRLDPFFLSKMKESGAPGMAVAVVGGGKIKWIKGYGLANIEENKPATPDTVFMLASISKTVTTVALMTLFEDTSRGLTLDSDVSDNLPFKVRHPDFPDTPITYRMLLTHTSGLIDSDAFQNTPELPGDSKISLLAFESSYVRKDDSWSENEPGTTYSYTNAGASLLGLVVEQMSGKNLQDYAKPRIFDKLAMPESSWFLAGLDQSHIAMPYSNGDPQGFYGYPDYPDGQLRTSATQLAHFLLMLTGKGTCGQRVLAPETVALMETPAVPDVDDTLGLNLEIEQLAGTKAFGHDGADKGVSTDMFYDPTTGNGFIILTNGSANYDGTDAQYAALEAMNAKLMELAQTLP